MKKVVVIAAAILMLFSITPFPAMAESSPQPNSNSATTVQPRDVQTKWFYRTYNCQKQMRLWSITDGCWLTDWIDCP